MKTTTRITLAALLMVGSQTMANFSGSDNFNNNSVDSSKWDLDQGELGEFYELNGRLEFVGNTDEAGAIWILNSGSYTEDWSVVCDVHNSEVNRIAGMFVEFGPDYSWINIEHHQFADLFSEHLVIAGYAIYDEDEFDEVYVYEGSAPITNDTVKLSLSYDSESKTISGAYNIGQGFVVVTNFSIADIGMTAADTFYLGVYAGTESEISVTPGTLYFDNFVAAPIAVLDADIDGDGLDPLAEYIAGTNPTNGASVFEVSDSGSSPSGYVLNWTAIEGRAYTVKWTDHLTNSFSVLTNGISYPQNSYTDTVHSAEGEGFYNLEVELEN